MSYLDSIDSGNWTAPDGVTIVSWCEKYCLSRREFCQIAGIKNEKKLYEFIRNDRLPYAQTRLFLIWSKQVEPAHFDDPPQDFFEIVKLKLINQGKNLDWLCHHLNIPVAHFHTGQWKDREGLKDNILGNQIVVDFLDLKEGS